MNHTFIRLLFISFVLLGSSPTFAEKRVALVIGNSAYKHTIALPNPKNDAKALTATLKRLGFDVLGGTDLSRTKFEKVVVAFSKKLRNADVGLFFYAGHGLQVSGQNYLVPIDAELSDEAGLMCWPRWSVQPKPISSSLMPAAIIHWPAIWRAPWGEHVRAVLEGVLRRFALVSAR